MKKRGFSLKVRMVAVMLAVIALVFTVLTVLFLRTTASLKDATVQSLGYQVEEIQNNIDNLMRNVQAASEMFADDTRLTDLLDKEYRYDNDKRLALTRTQNNIFTSYNRTDQNAWIGAIYNTETKTLFNYTEFDRDDEETIDTLLSYGITRSENLSRYYWYPLGDNPLTSVRTGDTRSDSVVLGSRRIYKSYQAGNPYIGYPYVHLFAVQEAEIYACYAQHVELLNGEVYVLNGTGGLISSSNIEAVEERAIDTGLWQLVENRESDSFAAIIDGRRYFVQVQQSQLKDRQEPGNGWLTVLLVPQSSATEGVTQLYAIFLLVLALCLALCFGLMLYLYRQFMQPISTLSGSMRRVDKGDMSAYAKEEKGGNEAAQMLRTYNRMLASINRNIDEKLALEQTKKELDMQVLTSQINPHFLYNTLETIVWKAGQAGRPDIGKIAASLGKLYRLSISGGAMFVPLRQEMEHLRSYLAIQRARYPDQFVYLERFDESLGDVQVPKIMLQPIVENILLYAVPEAEHTVSIRVTVRKVKGEVHITVLDNGPGMPAARLEAVRQQIATGIRKEDDAGKRRRSTGIGLHNISARLDLYMGAPDALQILSKETVGTVVKIRIPYRKNME